MVQGEGRGHMSQAMTLALLIERAGHEVSHVFLGSSHLRQTPAYFSRFFDGRLSSISSPNFIRSKDQKSVDLGRSLFYNLGIAPRFLHSLTQIHQQA
ncbi:MAG: glycosyltransferase, partial [Cytophagales bacterium]|nr:glycosyltransferase [Cytophagales bacterium]